MKRTVKVLSFILMFAVLLSCIPSGLSVTAANDDWAGAWGTPAIESGITLGESDGMHLRDYIPARSTIRTVITPTIGGTKIRLKFSNLFGPKAITINETTVAQTGATDDVIDESTVTQVTFNGGYKYVTIEPGSEVYSDPINFATTALKKISISSYFEKTTYMYTEGLYNGVTYLTTSQGNRTHEKDMSFFSTRLTFTSGAITYYTIPFLTRLDIYAPDAYSVVLLGDSTVTNDIAKMLAEKLHANGIHNVGVVMSGIIGNALRRDGVGLLGKVYGESLLERAERDAFNVAGVKYVIVKVGVNDVLHPMLKSSEGKLDPVTASDIISGYRELGQKAYARGINVYLCTRTPFKGYTRNFMGSDDLEWKQEGEDKLLEINKWIKNSATDYNFAGYIDLDAVRDPKDSAAIRPHMTSDGAHFTEYGQIAVTDLIPEYAYGVNRELRDYADIRGINPYVAPVVEKPTNNNNNNNNNSGETTTNKQETPTTGSNAENITNNNNGGGIVVAPENNANGNSGNAGTTPTMPNANEILVDTPLDNNAVNGNANGVGSEAARQMAGFAILAAVAMAIIAVASVMLIKLRPASSNGMTRGGKGRANQKKRV